MKMRRDLKIHQVSLKNITVLNPRERGKRKFQQIVNNISKLGLKKPITVTPKDLGKNCNDYYLVCGQGRYEAYLQLGEAEIPALIVNISKEELLLMSLVENLARRQHTPVEMIREIVDMHDKGYTFTQIAAKTALDVGYVRGMFKLLKDGEERLLVAVEKGQIPVYIGVIIASSDDQQIQNALTEAYKEKKLRGGKLLAARRLIEKRKTDGKAIRTDRKKQTSRAITSDEIVSTYQEETARQRREIAKAKLSETRLILVVSALRKLFDDNKFVTLLQNTSLDTLPKFLSTQLNGENS